MIPVLLLIAGQGMVQSDFFVNGNRLISLCAEDPSGRCLEYVAGASDMLDAYQAYLGKKFICPSAQVTLAQERDIVLKRMNDDPVHRDRPAAEIIASALSDAFPCAK